jgi:hypothetical protein
MSASLPSLPSLPSAQSVAAKKAEGMSALADSPRFLEACQRYGILEPASLFSVEGDDRSEASGVEAKLWARAERRRLNDLSAVLTERQRLFDGKLPAVRGGETTVVERPPTAAELAVIRTVAEMDGIRTMAAREKALIIAHTKAELLGKIEDEAKKAAYVQRERQVQADMVVAVRIAPLEPFDSWLELALLRLPWVLLPCWLLSLLGLVLTCGRCFRTVVRRGRRGGNSSMRTRAGASTQRSAASSLQHGRMRCGVLWRSASNRIATSRCYRWPTTQRGARSAATWRPRGCARARCCTSGVRRS